MSDFSIRPARSSDLPTIIGLWRELQDINAAFDSRLKLNSEASDWFVNYLEEQLDNTSAAVVVAEKDDRVVGYSFGQVMRRPTLLSGDCGYIADICVNSAARGQGIGRSLHGWLRAWFVAQGITAVEVQVVRANPASQAFWRKMGYQDFLRTLRSEG
jgi:ribosomal protein S18 acetylase RimI-like enzyme